MSTLLMNQLEEGLVDLTRGLYLISESYHKDDEWSDYLLSLINGEGEGEVVQSIYAETFFLSLDEEVSELMSFVEEFTGKTITYSQEVKGNSLQCLVKGFTLAFLGARKLLEATRENEQLRIKLENFKAKDTGHYQPFNVLGIEGFYDKFVDFRYEYLRIVSKKRGFKVGDIVDYCNEFFEIEEIYGDSGFVHEVSDTFERKGLKVSDFKWSIYDVDCILVEMVESR